GYARDRGQPDAHALRQREAGEIGHVGAGRDLDDQGGQCERGKRVQLAQCASSQLSAARASTCSGTDSSTAGNGASCMVCCTTGRVAATSASGTPKINSSCTRRP